MRIAYVVDRFPMISETFVLAQIVGMIDRGHDVRIFAHRRGTSGKEHPLVAQYRLRDITTYAPPAPRSPALRVRAAASAFRDARRAGRCVPAARALNAARFGRAALSLRLLISAAPFLRHDPFDVVHCQFGHLATEMWQLRECGVLQGIVVTSFRGTDAMRVAATRPERFARLFADGEKFLAVSHAVRNKLIEVGCDAGKIEVLRSGIDLHRFGFRGYHSIGTPINVISVGRLAPNKGIDFCIEAVSRLLQDGHKIRYRIIGDGPSRTILEQQVERLGIGDSVQFDGPMDSAGVIEALQSADILVAPSITGPDGQQEGLPNAPKEAMAVGVLVIASAIGGIPELVRDGETGVLVEERDSVAIADAIVALRDAGSSLRPMIDAARELICRDFDICVLNDRLERIYLEQVAG
jgi:colanic acid/amylovoran biosynthesis glycosyltransferase